MEVVILPTPKEVGSYAARTILEGVTSGDISVLGVATGSSPLPIYQALAEQKEDTLRDLTCFALDEYVGLPYSHPESYHAVINREVTRPLGLDPTRVHVPDGIAEDLERECRKYEKKISSADGIDLQILGIGSTGHIGFNEPTSSFGSRTRIKTLAPSTRSDNARFFASPEDVPMHCLTQGLGTILDAKKILLVAHGQSKAAAVAAAVEGPLTSMCPGSALQLHRNAIVVLDEPAASLLSLRTYYQFVFDHKPAWQR